MIDLPVGRYCFELIKSLCFQMTIQAANDNVVLGSVSKCSSSQFGAASTESHFVNNNGIQQKVTTTSSYEQKPDGSCVRKVVEEKNGVTEVREEVVDCEQAKKNVAKQSQETQKEIHESSVKLNQHIQSEQKRIEESIKKQMDSMKQMNSFHFF